MRFAGFCASTLSAQTKIFRIASVLLTNIPLCMSSLMSTLHLALRALATIWLSQKEKRTLSHSWEANSADSFIRHTNISVEFPAFWDALGKRACELKKLSKGFLAAFFFPFFNCQRERNPIVSDNQTGKNSKSF